MGKHKTSFCETCLKEFRTDNLKRHGKVCAGREQTTKENHQIYQNIKDVIHGAFKHKPQLVHCYYQTGTWATDKTESEFLSNFKIFSDLECECGVNGQCKFAHKHIIAEFLGPLHTAYKKLGKFFSIKNAYRMRRLTKSAKDQHKLATQILYIQTVKGKHKKIFHKNPNTLPTLKHTREYMRGLFGEMPWCNALYGQHLVRKINKAVSILNNVEGLTPHQQNRIHGTRKYNEDRLDMVEDNLKRDVSSFEMHEIEEMYDIWLSNN